LFKQYKYLVFCSLCGIIVVLKSAASLSWPTRYSTDKHHSNHTVESERETNRLSVIDVWLSSRCSRAKLLLHIDSRICILRPRTQWSQNFQSNQN